MSTVFPNIKTFFFYGIGAASLIALADYLPKVAIMFTFILIAGVFLTHWQDYTGILSGTQAKGGK